MITVESLTKTFGKRTAVDRLTFDVVPGQVTGFLGPNGAGKSTTMRMMLELDRPTAGSALINGVPYSSFREPLREVGALLDAQAMHPGRSGLAHLRIAARTSGLPAARADDALERVGLSDAGRRRIKGYSLGMRQRLGIASALLGDPGVLIFDEPVNGLDVDGVRWIRSLLRQLADDGRTVLVSSHLMSELQLIADRVIIIGQGKLLADATLADFIDSVGGRQVHITTPDPNALLKVLSGQSVSVTKTGPDTVSAEGLTAAEVGQIAHEAGIRVLRLADVEESLEQAYLKLTAQSVEYSGTPADGRTT